MTRNWDEIFDFIKINFLNQKYYVGKDLIIKCHSCDITNYGLYTKLFTLNYKDWTVLVSYGSVWILHNSGENIKYSYRDVSEDSHFNESVKTGDIISLSSISTLKELVQYIVPDEILLALENEK